MSTMQVICLQSEALYQLVDKVVEHRLNDLVSIIATVIERFSTEVLKVVVSYLKTGVSSLRFSCYIRFNTSLFLRS